MNPVAPSAAELLRNPIVDAAIEAAWIDSQSDDPAHRHEEGGWIYCEVTSGAISVRRASAGVQGLINLNSPPAVDGCVVVGKFHTHPNATAEGWDPGPSLDDQLVDDLHGVPDLICSDQGMFFSGPDTRRGGLGGNPGYPD
jgi:hypothetical protein